MRLNRLQARLMNAVMSIMGASISTSSWYRIRSVASRASHMTIAQMISTEARAPRISALWYPKESEEVWGFWLIHIENILIRKPATSESMWAASVRMARELDMIPPIISTTMKPKQMTTTIIKRLKARLAFFYFILNSSSSSNKHGHSLVLRDLSSSSTGNWLGCI